LLPSSTLVPRKVSSNALRSSRTINEIKNVFESLRTLQTSNSEVLTFFVVSSSQS
jgi:hypothetical protein